MKFIEYPLQDGKYINRFLTTGIYTKEQQFSKVTLHGKVNEWLKKGFAIHENPCRKEFIDVRQKNIPEYVELSMCRIGDKIQIFEQERSIEMYFPFGNIGMENSGFYFVPTYLRSYHYTTLWSDEKRISHFKLHTCGGATIWLNEELVTDFTPFDRNRVQSTKVSLDLKIGKNDIVICLDDLAERDTDYYFQLEYLELESLSMKLPINEQVNVEKLYQFETVLKNIYFEKEAYISEQISLQIENSSPEMFEVSVMTFPGEFIEKLEPTGIPKKYFYQLLPGAKQLDLFHSDDILPGYGYFIVSIQYEGIDIQKKIGNQVVRKELLMLNNEDISVRKKQALMLIANEGVDNVYKAAALFYLNQNCKKAESIILNEIEGVRKRKDCSDFHFVIILYIYSTYSDIISNHLKYVIEDVMKGYRYWIDEPGDDVMWFFSENHALLFHICQYLAGSYLPDETFINSGLTGRELKSKALRLLDEWFDHFFTEFITEWNSSAYIPIDILGLATLYNLTDEGSELHEKAKKSLDMISYCLSVKQHKGLLMTTFGRTYEKELKGNYTSGTTSLLYLLFNIGNLNHAANAYIALALGSYEPPKSYEQYLKLEDGKALIHENTQGYEQHVDLYLYRNADVVLSSAIGFKPFKCGYQEHITHAAIDGLAQVFINHPGESHVYGNGRPNFWSGNGILPMAMQHESVSLLKFDILDSHRIDYTHAYAPLSEFDDYIHSGQTVVLVKDGGLIGLKAENGLELQEIGPCANREFISPGRLNAWVLTVARREDYKNLNDFFRYVDGFEIKFGKNKMLEVTSLNGLIYRIDSENNCSINNQNIYQFPLDEKGVIEIIPI